MAAKKKAQSKSPKASKSKLGKGLKAKSTKKKTAAKSGKAATKKTAPEKKPAPKKKAVKKTAAKPAPAPKIRKPARAKPAVSKKSPRRARLSTFSAALKIYETGVKLMQSEKFERAKTAFSELIKEFPNETELLDRAHVLTQACDKRILKGKKAPQLQGADDYYEVGVAQLNGHEVDKALENLLHALKLAPNGDHILYALAAVSALKGDRKAALDYLGKAIQQRHENRFLATNDEDFESLSEDSDFIQITTSDAS